MRVCQSVMSHSVIVVLAFTLSAGCGRMERGKQIRAQAQLQYLSALIENHCSEGQPLPTLEELRSMTDAGRFTDPWGNDIQYELLESPSGNHYILASLGSDRTLDVERLSDYIGADPEDVEYDASSDVVLVDGRFIRNAGK